MAASVLSRTQVISNRLSTIRSRIESGQVFQLQEIKAVREESENLVIDWRRVREFISDDTYFSVLEVLTSVLSNINRVYLEAITRGRGRIFRDFVVFREENEIRDVGFVSSIDQKRLRPENSRYNPNTGANRVDYQYRNSFRYTVKFSDTLQSIAKEFTGSEDNWHFIARVNGMSRTTELESGDEIVIPSINSFGGDTSELDDFVISESPDRDFPSGQNFNLGTDILVDPERGVVVERDGKVSTVSGVDNVKQALNHRLQTRLGSLIRHSETYGLAAVVGAPGVFISNRYVRMSIANTLIKDPRVAQILRIRVRNEGDVIQAEVAIRLIRNAGEVEFLSTLGG